MEGQCMAKIEFNLLDEPWIRVIGKDCTLKEVSIRDALLNAHDYLDLAGEMATQDVAVLRMLIAVVHTIFSRVDENGENYEIESEDDALDRWQAIWDMQKFPPKPLEQYFEKWHERFWLFHPEYPFWQSNSAKDIEKEYNTAKFNCEIYESENKNSLFSAYSGKEKFELSYAQAARWMLTICGFDDCSSKSKNKINSLKAGWLGRIGIIYTQGSNLFETLWLNSVMLMDGEKLWDEDKPCWELDEPRSGEKIKIPLPDNYAELLTLQSRRLFLLRNEDKVIGFKECGGDFFESENTFCEQMTIWKAKKNKNSVTDWLPCEHDSSKQLWREFPIAFGEKVSGGSSGQKRPGIVDWITLLQKEKLISRKKVSRFRIVAVKYGNTTSGIKDYFSDSLSFYTTLLNQMNTQLRGRIIEEIQKCEKIALYLKKYQEEIDFAMGWRKSKDKSGSRQNNIQDEFYYEIDMLFKSWLNELDPEIDNSKIQLKFRELQEKILLCAFKIADQQALAGGPAAIVGKTLADEDVHYSSPEALNHFRGRVYSLYKR